MTEGHSLDLGGYSASLQLPLAFFFTISGYLYMFSEVATWLPLDIFNDDGRG